MRLISTLVCVSALASLFAVGCGGSDDDKGSPNSGGTGLPAGTKLSEVDTDAEAKAACDALASSFSASDAQTMTKAMCTYAGLMAAAFGSDCATTQSSCMKDGSSSSVTEEDCTAADFPKCTDVTVEEYQACEKAMIGVQMNAFKDLSCTSDLSKIPQIAVPTACSDLTARCPEIAGKLTGG